MPQRDWLISKRSPISSGVLRPAGGHCPRARPGTAAKSSCNWHWGSVAFTAKGSHAEAKPGLIRGRASLPRAAASRANCSRRSMGCGSQPTVSGRIAAAAALSNQIAADGRPDEEMMDCGSRRITAPGRRGCLPASRQQLASTADAGRRLYDPEKHASHRRVYGGHDPGVCAGYFGAQAELVARISREGARKHRPRSFGAGRADRPPVQLRNCLAITFVGALPQSRRARVSALHTARRRPRRWPPSNGSR